MSEQEKLVKSPCVSICVLDEEDVCSGCFRSGDEISCWGSCSNDERREVLQRAVERARSSSIVI